MGAGGALIPRWTNGVPRWLPTEFYWVFGCSYTGLPEELAPVRNPIGANMAVRKKTLEEIGGFREAGAGEEPRAIRSRGVVRALATSPTTPTSRFESSSAGPSRSGSTSRRAKVHHTVTGERASLSYFLRRSFEEGAGKARLAGFVGSQDGLSSERRHLAVVLPRGIARASVSSSTGIRAAASGPSRSSSDSPPARSDSHWRACIERTRGMR